MPGNAPDFDISYLNEAAISLETYFSKSLRINRVGVCNLKGKIAVHKNETVTIDTPAHNPVDASRIEPEKRSCGIELVVRRFFDADLTLPPAL